MGVGGSDSKIERFSVERPCPVLRSEEYGRRKRGPAQVGRGAGPRSPQVVAACEGEAGRVTASPELTLKGIEKQAGPAAQRRRARRWYLIRRESSWSEGVVYGRRTGITLRGGR